MFDVTDDDVSLSPPEAGEGSELLNAITDVKLQILRLPDRIGTPQKNMGLAPKVVTKEDWGSEMSSIHPSTSSG